MCRTFDEMVKKLSPVIHRITYRLNGHFTFFNDDDLYQEALSHLWVLYGKGVLNDKTESYILQGCYFHLKNYIRKTMDKATTISINELIGDGEVTLGETIAASNESEEYNEVEASILSKNAALDSLSDREKEVLRLSLDGLTVREIGSRLGVSHVMVVKIKARIKEKCKALKNPETMRYQN